MTSLAPIAGDVRLDAQLQRGEPQLVQPFGLGFDEGRQRDVGQRLAPPQGEGIGEHTSRPPGIAGGQRLPAIAHQDAETLGVQVVAAE